MRTNNLRDIPKYVMGYNTAPMHQMAHFNPVNPSTFNYEPLIDASLGFYMLSNAFLSKQRDEVHYLEVDSIVPLMY